MNSEQDWANIGFMGDVEEMFERYFDLNDIPPDIQLNMEVNVFRFMATTTILNMEVGPMRSDMIRRLLKYMDIIKVSINNMHK